MKKFKKLGILAIGIILSSISVNCSHVIHQHPEKSNQSQFLDKPYIVLVSIDGYRNDYTDLYSPPTLKKIREEGVSVKGLLPVYPSKTYTNHYSIATGLYSENHGIVGNSFFDPVRNEFFVASQPKNAQDGSWFGGLPLWVAAEKQGMIAASFFWPGSEADIQGIRPSYFVHYDGSIPNKERIHQVIEWLRLPAEKRPHFITLYFSDVDSAGHRFGPDSQEVKSAVLKIDEDIKLLKKELSDLKLPIDLVIISDHGMQSINQTQIEFLDDYTDFTHINYVGDEIQGSIFFKDPSMMSKVYGELKAKAKHFQVYKREEVPSRLHFSHNLRCGDLVIVTQAPYLIGLRNKKPKAIRGGHGYDVDVTPAMQGIFYAEGPQFKLKKKLGFVRNIHVYPILMKILGLTMTAPIDGDIAVMGSVLK